MNDKKLKKILLEAKLLEKKEIKTHLLKANEASLNLEEYLAKEKIIQEKNLYEAIANYSKTPFIDLEDKIIPQDILFLIPEPIARSHQIIAFKKEKNYLNVATTDPDDLPTFEFIGKKTNLKIKTHLTTPTSIKGAVKQYHQNLENAFKSIKQSETQEKANQNKDLKKLAGDLPIIRVINTLLEYAIFANASDVHIEPAEEDIIVRYRVDGILKTVMTLPKYLKSGVIARIKILANLKLDEHRLPQDGRFKIETKEYKISFRVSIIPILDGEKVVMRVLNEKNELLSLKDLGFNESYFKKVTNAIKKPHGMILVCGPTGSGKTTTLYTILNQINNPEINITTIEDPIEYRLPHINQTQVNSKIGFSFANGLRSLLRQDPDVIMVGEIRDLETAGIAINAAMTGHLVLSTLHTNDASGTLPRLLDMGTQPFLISSTVNLIIAQRLVRKICRHCIYSYKLNKENLSSLEKEFNIAKMTQILAEQQMIVSKDIKLKSLLFFKGKGCARCGDTGYSGRTGIYEILEITPKIASSIMLKKDAGFIKNQAITEQKMITMQQDGFIKAKLGQTTIEEVLRVTKD